MFVNHHRNLQAANLPILYMDETNFNLHISRREGRFIRGTRVQVSRPGSKGANVHVIGRISLPGLVYHSVKGGGFLRKKMLKIG